MADPLGHVSLPLAIIARVGADGAEYVVASGDLEVPVHARHLDSAERVGNALAFDLTVADVRPHLAEVFEDLARDIRTDLATNPERTPAP